MVVYSTIYYDNSAPRHRNRSILGQVEATGLPELSEHHIALTDSQEEEKHQFQIFEKSKNINDY